MHGSVLHGFKQFVVVRHGKDAWSTIARPAGVSGMFTIREDYADEQLATLVRATAAHEKRSVPNILENFGAAIVPTLVGLYDAFVVPAWRTLDLLENTENVIHRTIRMRDAKAHPPHLRTRRVSAQEVHIEYTSERRLCAFALGICQGVAAHYGETI